MGLERRREDITDRTSLVGKRGRKRETKDASADSTKMAHMIAAWHGVDCCQRK